MNIGCPDCSTVYRIDPARVPQGGISARCRECGAVLRVEGGLASAGIVRTAAKVEAAPAAGGTTGSGAETAGTAADTGGSVDGPEAESAGGPGSAGTGSAGAAGRPRTDAPAFGPQDPQVRAQRLARALVSDIVVYNPDKWEESRSAGTLRKDFKDDILKSWDEYVEQVGEEMAKKTPYFRDALNSILAEGKKVF